ISEAKRVLDLPQIVEALARREVPVQLSITGWGADEQALWDASRHLSERGLIQFCGPVPEERLHALYEENDILILTSDHEGKPISLVEGMGRGCIPVVTDIPSGIPELAKNGVNGYLVPGRSRHLPIVSRCCAETDVCAIVWRPAPFRRCPAGAIGSRTWLLGTPSSSTS